MDNRAKQSISRRELLKLLGAGSAGIVLSGCKLAGNEVNQIPEKKPEEETMPQTKQSNGTQGIDQKAGDGKGASFDLSTGKMRLVYKEENQHLLLDEYSTFGTSWIDETSAMGLYAVHINGERYTAKELAFESGSEDFALSGRRDFTASFKGPGFTVEQHSIIYEDTALMEVWLTVKNASASPCRIERIDSFSFDIPKADYKLDYYTSQWGGEFELWQEDLNYKTKLESRAGRASNGQHPWFALIRDGKQTLSGSVVWSGNWIFRFEPLNSGGQRICGGLNDWSFEVVLSQGESLESPHVVLVLGDNLNTVSQQYARVGRKYWYPRNVLSARLPVEWNHWWSYEDARINEEVFLQNVDIAAEMGIEVCTLDAGWFGPSSAGTHWYEYRGDWHLVNDQRFPHGIRLLSDRTHAKNMAFGLWCEIEGLGGKAQLARDHPEYVALRDGNRLGYVCFGNPDVQEWAFQTLSGLIKEYDCDWIKLDFNLDPGAGCSRTDHGHQAGDGLKAHYEGYYKTLERVRKAFPDVILENCSSGGLRIDLGILRQTYMTYLSDPDWPVHDLQLFWGASTMLATDVLLHWGFCDWQLSQHPQQTFNPHDPQLTQTKLDYYTRTSMLGMFGFSQKLPDLPEWVAERWKTHIRFYKDTVRRFVKEADLYRLTDQPKRNGKGERWCAFQYSLPDGSEHLLFVFRLPGARKVNSIQMLGLIPMRKYSIRGLEGEYEGSMTGKELMEDGLSFPDLEEEGSVLLKINETL